MTLLTHSPHRRLDRTRENGIYDVTAECCGTCRFWQPDIEVNAGKGTTGPLSPDDLGIGFGACRRRPPTVIDALARVMITPPRYDQQLDAEKALDPTTTWDCTRFPGTFATTWCGDFEKLPGLWDERAG